MSMTPADLRALMATAERQPGETTEQYNARSIAEHQLSSWRAWLPGLLDALGGPLTLADAFDIGRGWQSMLTGQTLEDSRAVGRTLGCDLFEPIADAINREEKRLGFNPFQSSDHGICKAVAIIKAALDSLSPIAPASQASGGAPAVIRSLPAGAHSSEVIR